MAKTEIATDYKSLRNIVLPLFNEDHNAIVPVVSHSLQQRELELLKETTKDERFFFVVDMLNFEITECHGINKWLGYSEEDFSLKFYVDKLLHPGIKKALLIIAQQMYGLLCSGIFELHFIVQRFTGVVALKHQKGHYLLIKKASAVFQYDTHSRMLSYIDEFTIIGELDEQRLQELVFGARHVNVTGVSMDAQQQKIMEQTMAHFMGMKIFSPTEIQVARKIAYNNGITRKELAAEFDVSIHTITTFYKRFMEKTRNFFQKDFSTMENAALFLRKEGFL